ncbi:MAG: DUF177 domain-containing protein [Chloroflexi bacterium]|nr:DUF177 domain-containing protein [Chloroflexota bacterium]
MQFNVAQLLKEPTGSTREHIVEAAATFGGPAGEQVVRGRAKLTRTQYGVWVHAVVETSFPCTCSRCLADFRQSLSLEFDEEYYPTIDIRTGLPLPLPKPEEEAFLIDAHHILDLGEAVRQYTIMSLPMKPLCRPECGGVCPQCGANRNQVRCSCQEQGVNPRWNVFRQLFPSPNA